MNAQEAKKMAAAHKKQQEENLKVKAAKAENADIALLYTHFKNKVEEAANSGKMHTDEILFPSDRFEDRIVQEVADKLREEGFNLNKETQNAYKKTKFTISWA